MRVLACFAIAVILLRPSVGQSPPGLYHSLTQVPAVLDQQYVAHGDGLQKPGNERITLTGTLTDSTGVSMVQIVIELGGELNVSWIGKPSQRLVFTGTNTSVLDDFPNSSDFLEAFVEELP